MRERLDDGQISEALAYLQDSGISVDEYGNMDLGGENQFESNVQDRPIIKINLVEERAPIREQETVHVGNNKISHWAILSPRSTRE